MFSFFHPKPVVDGRAVAVKVVQQKASAQHDTRTLVVTSPKQRLDLTPHPAALSVAPPAK